MRSLMSQRTERALIAQPMFALGERKLERAGPGAAAVVSPPEVVVVVVPGGGTSVTGLSVTVFWTVTVSVPPEPQAARPTAQRASRTLSAKVRFTRIVMVD